jgi:hypothetical protein
VLIYNLHDTFQNLPKKRNTNKWTLKNKTKTKQMDLLNFLKKELENAKYTKQHANIDLKAHIISLELKLENSKKELQSKELPYDEEIKDLEKKIKVETTKSDLFKTVKKMRNDVHQLIHDGKCHDGKCHDLKNVFIGNRFLTFYYNDSIAGFYHNNGCFEESITLSVNRKKPSEEVIEFNNYEAYKIAESNLTELEKYIKLNELFNAFLG